MPKLETGDVKDIVISLPSIVLEQLKNYNLVLAGGYVRDIISKDEPNDIDLYPTGVDFTSAALTLRKKISPDTFSETNNAWNFLIWNNFLIKGVMHNKPINIQIIWSCKDNAPYDIIEGFDFTVCQGAIWYDKEKGDWDSICGDTFYIDLNKKMLRTTARFNNQKNYASNISRFLKFVSRGYTSYREEYALLLANLVKQIIRDKPNNIEEYINKNMGVNYPILSDPVYVKE